MYTWARHVFDHRETFGKIFVLSWRMTFPCPRRLSHLFVRLLEARSQFPAGVNCTCDAARCFAHSYINRMARQFSSQNLSSQNLDKQTVGLCGDVAPLAPRRVTQGMFATLPNEITIPEALQQMRVSANVNFHESVDVAVRLGIDARRSDLVIRGVTNLPHPTGKAIRVCVFADGIAADEARDAGAHIVGAGSLVDDIKLNGLSALNFDKAIAHEKMLPKLAEIAGILGRRGMMPNRKVGTVTSNVGDAVRVMLSGRIEFRAEKNAIVHAAIGKLHSAPSALEENVLSFLVAVMNLRPRGVKGAPSESNFVKDIVLSSTMGKHSYRVRKYAMRALPQAGEL